jgi:protocatechuate 3,4-dioxygenase beta subunit
MMHKLTPLLLTILLASCAQSQNVSQDNFRLVGGPCEGCEAIIEYGDQKLTPVDTLPDFNDPGPRMKVTGVIYQSDGKTPASDVILYIYHTDQGGVYPKRGDETGWGRRHGYIRGWIKTGKDGRYTFYTLKPGVYPNRSAPAHIHPIVVEPNGKYYWLDAYHFKGDPLLTEKEINPTNHRGVVGLVTLEQGDDLLIANKDIILGKNIPDYE